MIPCPSCGTRNRRGSKYCYRCGQPLDVVFNISCPACDRLNPGGSVFCAFCGAKLPGPVSAAPAREPAVAGQPVVVERRAKATPEPLKSELKKVEPAASPPPELPPWLYEQPAEPSAKPPVEESKYLNDIAGALPKSEGWLSSVSKPEGKPTASPAPQSKPKAQGGCLALALLAVLGAVALVLITAM